MSQDIQWKAVQKSDLGAKIEKYCRKWQPKQIGSYQENGITVKVFEPAYGCQSTQIIR